MRLLGTPPQAGYNLSKLREEAQQHWPTLIDLNEIDDGAQLALYVADGSDVTDNDWQAVLDAHDPNALSSAQQARADAQQMEQFLLNWLDPNLSGKGTGVSSSGSTDAASATTEDVLATVIHLLLRDRGVLP